MRLFEILMMAANTILILNLVFGKKSHTVNPEESIPEALTPGVNNYWARNSWAGCLQPAKPVTRSIRASIILSVLSVVFTVTSILAEGFRLFMAPAYLLSVILLLYWIIRAIREKSAAYEAAASSTVAVSLLFTISVASAFLFPVIDLPVPSGPYPVGTTLIAFTDASRRETHAASQESRKIPVQIWYPAPDTAGKGRVNWLSSRKVSKIFAECKHVPNILGQLTLVKTNGYMAAELSPAEEKYLVILFSGGGAMFNGQNAIQTEELASHGYIVCAVGHPYDDFACIYPDGSILPYDPKHLKALGDDVGSAIAAAKRKFGGNDSNPGFNGYIMRNCKLTNDDVRIWSGDMSFVADELARLNSGDTERIKIGAGDIDMFTGRLNMLRLGIFGHSFGGAAAGETCLHDARFKAFINMDGSPFGSAIDNVIPQPFMILTAGKNTKRIISEGYSAKQKNFMTVYIKGAEHMNFSDFNTILPNIGKLTGILGSIDSDRQRAIMNDYILAFFNRHLKDMPEPFLDSAPGKYPEVTVEKR